MRGIAILLVVACHAGRGLTGAGVEGVLVFFTLSGFLITSLLLEEGRARVGLRAFYARRARRLLPALAVVLVTIVGFGVWSSTGLTFGATVAIVFYVSNWYDLAHPQLHALSQTWSLAIEEQFYVLWPLVLIAVPRRWLFRICAAGVVAAFAAMSWGLARGNEAMLGRWDLGGAALLIGCGLAVWMHGRPEGRSRPGVAALGLLALAPFALAWPGWGIRLALQVITPIVAALVIWSSSQGDGVSFLGARPLRWVGRRSYAIYLWHFPLLWVGPGGLVAVGCEVALAFAMSEVSWRLVEAPALAWRRTTRTVPGAVVVPVARRVQVDDLPNHGCRLPEHVPVHHRHRSGDFLVDTSLALHGVDRHVGVHLAEADS